jgi:hypothetical protein
MLRTLSCSCLWVAFGLGAYLLLLPPLWAQSQLPGPTDQRAPKKLERPVVVRQQEAEAVRQAEAELEAKRAELLILETRFKAELERMRAEIRVAEQRLQQARQRLNRLDAAAQVPGTVEQRLQQLEGKIEFMQRELTALRQQRSVAGTAEKRFTPLDLQAKTNHKCKVSFQRGRYPGNTLASLPTGEQTFHGIMFQVGEGVIQLGSTVLQDKPAKVTGIPVGKKFSKLHILHATGFFLSEQDTPIGAYTVHYEDGTSATIPIIYGKDVLDWWKYPANPEPTRGKVAWEGENEGARGFGATIRLYLTTWENPHPAKTVTSIDYASTMDTDCAPFCVAITVEEP